MTNKYFIRLVKGDSLANFMYKSSGDDKSDTTVIKLMCATLPTIMRKRTSTIMRKRKKIISKPNLLFARSKH